MIENLITYENYKNNKEGFGHIGTWALFNEEAIKVSPSDVEKSYLVRNELIIANSEEEFKEKGLDRLLHGDVVIMPLNFSCPKESPVNPNGLVKVLNEYKESEHNKKRYDELIALVKEDQRYLYFNMYSSCAKNYGPGFMKSELLNGAYMTDFLKFVQVEGELLPAGIPESKSCDDVIKNELNERIDIHARGLKEEFDGLGIKPKVIVLCHSKLYTKDKEGNLSGKTINAITKALGYKPHFVKLNHYTPQGSVKKGNFESVSEAFEKREIKQLIEDIQDKLKTKIK